MILTAVKMIMFFWAVAPCRQIERYQDVGERYQDVGERYQDVGERYQDVGERYQDVGERYQDVGEACCLQIQGQRKIRIRMWTNQNGGVRRNW
jgi:predicted XRE-type DNA-binding protein